MWGGGLGKRGMFQIKTSPTKDVVTSSQKTAPGLIKYLGTYPLKMDGSMVGWFLDIMHAKKNHTPGVVYLIIVGYVMTK